MILYVFDGNSDLPSADVKSLQMMAYARFMNMNIEIVKRTYKPYIGYSLPELICERGSITELDDLIEYFKFEAGSNIDLNDKNLSKLDNRFKLYENMFQETLKPALISVQWVDDKNYFEQTRATYSAISRFPLNFIVPSYLRNQALNYMDSVYPFKARKEFFNLEIIERAKEIIKLLSENLSNSTYFNTSSPNEIDALIFGYLAFILKNEFPRLNSLQQCIKEHRNLVDYVERILNRYFQKQQTTSKVDKTKEVKENFESTSWKSLLLVGLFAITTNVLYCLYLVPALEEEESDDEDED